MKLVAASSMTILCSIAVAALAVGQVQSMDFANDQVPGPSFAGSAGAVPSSTFSSYGNADDVVSQIELPGVAAAAVAAATASATTAEERFAQISAPGPPPNPWIGVCPLGSANPLWIDQFPAPANASKPPTTYNSCYSVCEASKCCNWRGHNICEGTTIKPISCNCWCPDYCPKILRNARRLHARSAENEKHEARMRRAKRNTNPRSNTNGLW